MLFQKPVGCVDIKYVEEMKAFLYIVVLIIFSGLIWHEVESGKWKRVSKQYVGVAFILYSENES